MENKYKPSLALLTAALLYGLYGVYANLISLNFGVFSQAWARFAISSILAGAYLYITRQPIKLEKTDVKWLLAWVLSDAASMLLIFVAFNKIYVGTAYFLLYVGIILSGYIFGYILYQERFTKLKVFAAILSVVGMALILSVAWQTQNLLYMLMALAAGLAGGFWYTATAKLKQFSNMQLVFWDALIIFSLTFIISIVAGQHIPKPQFNLSWLGVVLFAVTDVVAVRFTVYGFQKLESHLGNLIMPLEIVFGAIFGFLFFRQVMPFTAWIGGLLIFTAALLPNLLAKKANNRA